MGVKYNYSKLNGKIKEVMGTQSKFAEKMGLSDKSVSMKLNSERGFTTNQIFLAIELLGIGKDEVYDYFFTKEVQKVEL